MNTFTIDSHTTHCVMDALDRFFITPSLANMVTVLHALQAHRALRFSRGDNDIQRAA